MLYDSAKLAEHNDVIATVPRSLYSELQKVKV